MEEKIEIRNDTPHEVTVSACRSKHSRMLYVEIGGTHNPIKIASGDYGILTVNQTEG